MYTCVPIYIYIYMYREREMYIHICVGSAARDRVSSSITCSSIINNNNNSSNNNIVSNNNNNNQHTCTNSNSNSSDNINNDRCKYRDYPRRYRRRRLQHLVVRSVLLNINKQHIHMIILHNSSKSS